MRLCLRKCERGSAQETRNRRWRDAGHAVTAASPPWPLLLLLLAMAATGAGGCAFTRGDLGMPFKEADIAAIKQGQSTIPDVVAVLGAPDEIIRLGNGRQAFHYFHYAMKHATLLVFSRVNIASDQLYVFFNAQGVVERVLFGERTQGLEFQFWPFDP
jgi:hypothetical protein